MPPLLPRTPPKAKPTATPVEKPNTRSSKTPVPTPSSSSMQTPPRMLSQRSSTSTVIRETPGYEEEPEGKETLSQHSPEYEPNLPECTAMAIKATELLETLKVTKACSLEYTQLHALLFNLVDCLEKSEVAMDGQRRKANETGSILQRLERMERDMREEMKELRETVTKSRTYAEVTAQAREGQTTTSSTTAKHPARPTLREHNTQTKVDQTKREFTLTTEGACEETKKTLEKMTSKEIVDKCQQVIDNIDMEGSKPKVQAANKLQNGNVKLFCRTPDEAKALKKINWNEVLEGLKERVPKYGIVVHSVPIEAVDVADKQSTMSEIEAANLSQNIPIIDVAPLRRNKNYVNTSQYQSIVVYTNNAEAADRCIKANELYIASGRYRAERYTPHLQIIQCYKCYGYGHRAHQCRHEQNCGKCGETHETKSCTNDRIKCINCGENHLAWAHNCSKRVAESRRLAEIKSNTSAFFSI
jgi:hypothetical protein